eukprot:4053100-Amphidinium_carterae.1
MWLEARFGVGGGGTGLQNHPTRHNLVVVGWGVVWVDGGGVIGREPEGRTLEPAPPACGTGAQWACS